MKISKVEKLRDLNLENQRHNQEVAKINTEIAQELADDGSIIEPMVLARIFSEPALVGVVDQNLQHLLGRIEKGPGHNYTVTTKDRFFDDQQVLAGGGRTGYIRNVAYDSPEVFGIIERDVTKTRLIGKLCLSSEWFTQEIGTVGFSQPRRIPTVEIEGAEHPVIALGIRQATTDLLKPLEENGVKLHFSMNSLMATHNWDRERADENQQFVKIANSILYSQHITK